jgi:hypothetical protein
VHQPLGPFLTLAAQEKSSYCNTLEEGLPYGSFFPAICMDIFVLGVSDKNIYINILHD